MTEDRSSVWKSESEVEVDLGDGKVVTLVRPDAQVFIQAGMDPLCFNVMVPDKKRGAKLQKELEKIQAAGNERLQDFMGAILKECMKNPKLWTGDHTETPAGYVHLRHLKQDAEVLFIRVFELAGFMTAEAAADAVRKFRPDQNGADGKPVGGALESETVSDTPAKSD